MSDVIVYIDGFNLYHGIRDAGWLECLWLDLGKFAASLLKQKQTLQSTKYFTALVRYPSDKRKRQKTFIEAIEGIGGIDILYGRYQKNVVTCNSCGHSWRSDNEKATDVQIAVELLDDAHMDRFDTAIVISADGDLVPAIRKIKTYYTNKTIIAFFPPKRHSAVLAQEVHVVGHLWRNVLGKCQLPNHVTSKSGYVLTRPPSWV